MECHEVPGFDQLRPYAASAVGGEGRIIDGLAFVMEGDEAGILEPVRLPIGDGEDHPLRDDAGGIEDESQTTVDTGGPAGSRGEPRGGGGGEGSVTLEGRRVVNEVVSPCI